MPSKSKRSLQDVVGKGTYAVWVDMLRELVPEGWTHRLSVIVAWMLEYAVGKSMQIKHRNESKTAFRPFRFISVLRDMRVYVHAGDW